MNTYLGNDKLIRLLRVYGILTTVWPLNPKVGKFKAFSYNILWWAYVLNGLTVSAGLIASIIICRNDFIYKMKSLVELTYTFEVVFNIFYCKIRKKELQKLLFGIKQYNKIWTPYEKTLGKKFTRYAYAAYIGAAIIFISGALAFIFAPILSHTVMPLNTIYPLPISELWGWCVIYVLNVFSVLQVSVTLILDLMIIIILWKAAFQFNSLGVRMRSVFTSYKLRAAIIEHQNIISYVRDANYIASYIIFKLTIVVVTYLITCNLVILNNVSFVEAFQFFAIAFASILRLYFYSWSAEMITEMAYDMSWQLYDSPWIYASPNLRRRICIIIQRCQKPVVISATSIVPIVSIKFCGRVFSLTLSYFLTLRTILRV